MPYLLPCAILLVSIPFALARMQSSEIEAHYQQQLPTPSMERTLHNAAEEESSSSSKTALLITESTETSSSSDTSPHSSASLNSSVSSDSSVSSSSPSRPTPHPPSTRTQSPLPATHAVAMYLTPTSVSRRDFLLETMEDTGTAGGNALVFDVKGSAVFFEGDSPVARELGLINKKTYDLAEVLQIARERRIYTIGRFVALKDAGLSRVRPDTIIAHPTSGARIGYEFVDPEDETVLRYNSEVLCALAAAGIDEINLDYIRFSTEQVGALRVYSPEEKSRKVGVFVQMARRTIDDCGPNTKLGISTYAILGWNFDANVATLGQDVVSFAPFVDIISPMAYPATFAENAYYSPGRDPGSRMYYLVWRTLEGYKTLLGPEHVRKLRPWIQGYGVTQKNMADQMKAVSDAGLCGFQVWNANNNFGVTYMALADWKRPKECGN